MGQAVAVVTGAARGMGLACARRLAATHHVVLTDLDAPRVELAAAALRDMGATATAVPCDVGDDVALDDLVESITRWGPLRSAVFAAGLSSTMADWRRIVAVNWVGTSLSVEAVLPRLEPGGVIVCFASIAAHLFPEPPHVVDLLLDEPRDSLFDQLGSHFAAADDPGMLAYRATKCAVIRLCERSAPRAGTRGIRILSVSPGLITDTPMGALELEAQPRMAGMISMTPLGRAGRADDVGAVVEFLCSPGAAFLTGTDIRVDGGCVAAVRPALEAEPPS